MHWIGQEVGVSRFCPGPVKTLLETDVQLRQRPFAVALQEVLYRPMSHGVVSQRRHWVPFR